MDLNFNFTGPKTVDVDTTGDAVLSFDAIGSITSGNIKFQTSPDGVAFTDAPFFSFQSSSMKPNISTATGFVTEDRGSFDVSAKKTTRIIASPDFQGNVNLSVCEVADAPEPKSNTCCEQPTMFFSQSIASDSRFVWQPTPGTKFVLMSYMIGVTGDASGKSPVKVSLLDGTNDIGQNHWVALPTTPATAVSEPLYTSPWISFGEGLESKAVNNPLQIALDHPLASGLAFVIVAGREV